MFKLFVTVDKHQHFKSFISDTAPIRLERSSKNAENNLLVISKLMSRASFYYNKIMRNLHLFLTKVAVKVEFMHKHFKWQLFTQVIYLQIMLNISRHYMARNFVCQQFA